MITSPPTIYLAGAIRNDRHEDIMWREAAIDALQHDAVIINPLAGKIFHTSDGTWRVYNNKHEPDQDFIVSKDFWAVDHSDVIIFNFLSFAEDYQSIGTMTEFGRSTSRSVIRYLIIPQYYTGHQNGRQFKLHPFLAKNATKVFHSVKACLQFVSEDLRAMSGERSRFGGYINDLGGHRAVPIASSVESRS